MTGAGLVNAHEVAVIAALVRGVLALGGSPDDVGVIAPLRSQLALLEVVLGRVVTGVEASTVDRFQGRDKPVILVSLVRSNEGGEVGTLLGDLRRLNVAFTRAKAKLLIVGSSTTLRAAAAAAAAAVDAGGAGAAPGGGAIGGAGSWRVLLDLLDEKGWMTVLPVGAHETADFVGLSS